jgi:hypothetical protein
MKKFYNFLAIVFLSILSHNVHSQSPGDIAFTAINVDGDEDFAFVLLTNLSNGTEIYFTENNWTGSAFSGTGEGQIKWTAGSDAYAGTIVVVNNINTGSPTVSSGTLSNKAGSWGLSSSNEGLYALSAAPATSYGSAPTFYASIHTDFSGSETISGTGLVSGTSSIDFDNDTDGVFFTGTRNGQTSMSDYKTAINNTSNWNDIGNGDGETHFNSFSTDPFGSSITWDGSESSTWTSAANWNLNRPSNLNDNVTIVESDDFQPTISSDVTVNNFTVSSGDVNVNQNGSLTVNGNFSNSGTIEFRSTKTSYSSLVISGTTSGNIEYRRWINKVGSGEWDLVGSPVSGQSIAGIVNQSEIATNGSSPTTYALGTYSNAASPGTWTNVTSNDTSGNMVSGKGYQMATDEGQRLDFTGTVVNSNTSVSITSPASGTKWNLVANPFPSYVNGNSNAGTNNFFSTNSGVLHDSFTAVYGWDADGSGYTVYNAANTWYIAPGQGFFVASANASGSSVSFNLNMRTITGTGSFVQDSVQDEVEIGLYNGDSRLDYTKLFFIPGLTLGLDKGYDAGHFNQSAPMMTRLSEGDEGYGMVYNAMGQEHLSQEVTIPLEINQSAGTNFTVRLESSTADDLKIYLQDTFKNTLTLLNESAFTLTAENDLSDVGRFNLITTPVTLSVDDITNNNQIRIYKSQGANYITVDGLSNTNGDVDFKLYNITGALVMSKTLDSNENRQHISSENLINGVYFAVLNNGTLASSKLFIK